MTVTADQGTRESLTRLEAELNHRVVGCPKQVRLLITALLARGHVLIQGAPGTGKTTLARTVAQSIDCSFNRIQFTPDLLPADLLGCSIYDQGAGNFAFHAGPVFCNVLLADEINRTTPRVQSALLEAMNERQVTVDGQTRQLDRPFFVIATQNDLYTTGTFPLPESQLDRFVLSFEMPRPDVQTQAEILQLHMKKEDVAAPTVVLQRDALTSLQDQVTKVSVCDELIDYAARLTEATHGIKELVTGISARGAISLTRSAQAAAFADGRDAVYPDDIKSLVPFIFKHRLHLRGRHRRNSRVIDHHIEEILDSTSVP